MDNKQIEGIRLALIKDEKDKPVGEIVKRNDKFEVWETEHPTGINEKGISRHTYKIFNSYEEASQAAEKLGKIEKVPVPH